MTITTTSSGDLVVFGDEDGDEEVDTVGTNVEEGLCRTVGLDVVAARHQDETDDVDGYTQSETERSAPDVEDLGIRELPDTTNNGGDDGSQSGQRVLLEVAGDVGLQTP